MAAFSATTCQSLKELESCELLERFMLMMVMSLCGKDVYHHTSSAASRHRMSGSAGIGVELPGVTEASKASCWFLFDPHGIPGDILAETRESWVLVGLSLGDLTQPLTARKVLLRNKSRTTNIIDDDFEGHGDSKRGGGGSNEVAYREKDEEIRLLQECLLELEIEYFRVMAENDMLRSENNADQDAFIEPWFRDQNRAKRKAREMEEAGKNNCARMRDFQDQVAAKGFASALNAQTNALSVAAGLAAQQRTEAVTMRYTDRVDQVLEKARTLRGS